MISYGVVKSQKNTSKSQQLSQYTVGLKRQLPNLCIVAPPKVQLTKIYISQVKDAKSGEGNAQKNDKRQPIKQNYEFVGFKQQKKKTQYIQRVDSCKILQEQKSIELKFPEHRIPLVRPIQREKIFKDKQSKNVEQQPNGKQEISQSNKTLLSTSYILRASSEFQFTRKNKKYFMPKDSTQSLILFQIQTIKPFDI